jgi:hypothetical protein
LLERRYYRIKMVNMKKKDAYEEHAGDFRNEAEVEEELEEEGTDLMEAERKHFEEDDDESKAI